MEYLEHQKKKVSSVRWRENDWKTDQKLGGKKTARTGDWQISISTAAHRQHKGSAGLSPKTQFPGRMMRISHTAENTFKNLVNADMRTCKIQMNHSKRESKVGEKEPSEGQKYARRGDALGRMKGEQANTQTTFPTTVEVKQGSS